MNPESNDPLLDRLRDLPAVPLDNAAVMRVQREARAALEGERRLEGRIARVWTGSILPALLVTAGLVYAWGSLTWMESVYVADHAAASR
jgi:hypothetical protein